MRRPVIIEHSVASLTELGGHALLDTGADVDMVAEDLVDRMEKLGINHRYPLKRGIFVGSVNDPSEKKWARGLASAITQRHSKVPSYTPPAVLVSVYVPNPTIEMSVFRHVGGNLE